jgi:hypothetical protein
VAALHRFNSIARRPYVRHSEHNHSYLDWGRLYPIPEPRDGTYCHEGLATSEEAGGEPGEEGKPMAKVAKRVHQRVHRWLIQYHMVLVIVLSVFHIGLASLPTRDSGTADCRLRISCGKRAHHARCHIY